MEKLQALLPMSEEKEIKILALGDWHWENPNCDRRKIKEIISYIESTPYTYAILMGDLMDCTTYATDKRQDLSVTTKTFLETLEEITKLIEPIKDKCLVALRGNHEDTIKQRGYGDPIFHLCSTLDIPYGGYSCFLKIAATPKTHKSNLIVYAHHGYWRGS